jgi:toxin-antitoxin system PIN domain toxin
VKIVDANVLLNAVNEAAAAHEPAAAWLRASLAGDETVGFSWVVLLGFLRLSTHPSVFPRTMTVEQAADLVDRWLAEPAAMPVHPSSRHAAILRTLLQTAGTGGNLVNDAHLAALAIERGGEVVSFDSDFARFPGLRWRTPSSE